MKVIGADTFVPPVGPTSISFNGLTAPGTLQQGSGAHISGTISSTGSPLSTVEAEVLTSGGSSTGIKASKSNVNSYSFSIYNSDIDWGLTFGKLGAGTYYIRYKATTADGKSETDETSTFQVNGNATVEPIIHIHSYERGYEAAHPHRVYMKCSTCGDVYYTGETTTMASCETCNPPATTEPATPAPVSCAHAYERKVESAHPHKVYMECVKCGDRYYTGETESVTSCESCWGPWTGWSTTPVSGSDTRQVETRQVKVSDAYTEYRYGRYVDPTGRHDCWCDTYFRSIGYTPILQYSDWSATRYPVADTGWTCGYCGGNHIGAASSSGGRSFWNEYRLSNGSYYWEEEHTVPAVEETQYRYRDQLR